MQQEKTEQIPQTIGSYVIEKKIAEGGMGEIFLARDPKLDRSVAIKRMKPSLTAHPALKKRFIREARINASLFHPAIIPILDFSDDEETFFVMPYIAGETLKTLLRRGFECEKKGLPLPPFFNSMQTVIRSFLHICEAISYAHSCGILHRDLKPENILVGHFGEVYLTDWGLAAHLDSPEMIEIVSKSEEKKITNPMLTRPGKVLGTLSYLAPEQVFGRPAGKESDVFALGVILYQLLTLRLPYYKKSIAELKKLHAGAPVYDATLRAPHRDIPVSLAQIATKCLMPQSKDRYSNVSGMIEDLSRYLAGDFRWTAATSLSAETASDWSRQDTIQLNKVVFQNPLVPYATWGFLHLSREVYAGNIRIDFTVTISADSDGIGIVLCSQTGIEGYLIWLGTPKNPGAKLEYDFVPLLDLVSFALEPGTHDITVMKIDREIIVMEGSKEILVYDDMRLAFDGRIGILQQDFHHTLGPLSVSIASQKAQISCLCIPDTFFRAGHFSHALSEYEKIAHSLAGTKESKEALFRAGLSLIELAKREGDGKEYLKRAFETFDLLCDQKAEPLAYLGKAMISAHLQDHDEELKYFEMGLRRFKGHPLLYRLEEHLRFRLHESIKSHRKLALHFSLLIIRHAPHLLNMRETHLLIHQLVPETHYFAFLKKPRHFETLTDYYAYLAIQIAFFLNLKGVLEEIQSELEDKPFFKRMVEAALLELHPKHIGDRFASDFILFEAHIKAHLNRQEAGKVPELLDRARAGGFPEDRALFLKIWAYVLMRRQHDAKLLLEEARQKGLTGPHTFFFIFDLLFSILEKGITLALSEVRHLSNQSFPPPQYFLLYFLEGKCEPKTLWHREAFFIEKVELQRQIVLFYTALGRRRKASYYERKLHKRAL